MPPPLVDAVLPVLQVIFCMDKSIELSPECTKFKVLKAECLALLRRYQESQEIVKYVGSSSLCLITYLLFVFLIRSPII